MSDPREFELELFYTGPKTKEELIDSNFPGVTIHVVHIGCCGYMRSFVNEYGVKYTIRLTADPYIFSDAVIELTHKPKNSILSLKIFD
jgi:hypothetical protein